MELKNDGNRLDQGAKGWASPENQKLIGNYPKLGRDVIKMIPLTEDFYGFMKLFVAEI